jgi:methylmalonyl-CoA mutase
VRYLSEITERIKEYNAWVEQQSQIGSILYQLNGVLTIKNLKENEAIQTAYNQAKQQLETQCYELIENWPKQVEQYNASFLKYEVRGKVLQQAITVTSLSGTKIHKIVLPKYKDCGYILHWQLQENVPGKFPYTAGVFELKRTGEDPTRMVAVEGGPERTNKRFHYVSFGQPAIRLSTAFDSVTLYGEDPAKHPDIYGKIGNSGVSIDTVDEAKKLYSGFGLCAPKTSVSMTINGPAPIILAFFLHAAIDQLCEKYIE